MIVFFVLKNNIIDAFLMWNGFCEFSDSFEDKRRENFEKGQAELERRRKALLDAQRRETEERLRRCVLSNFYKSIGLHLFWVGLVYR